MAEQGSTATGATPLSARQQIQQLLGVVEMDELAANLSETQLDLLYQEIRERKAKGRLPELIGQPDRRSRSPRKKSPSSHSIVGGKGDTTTVNTARVTVQVKLAEDGTNYILWHKHLCYAAAQKGEDVGRALLEPLQFTVADAAAQILITSSIPDLLASQTQMCMSAYEQMQQIRSQYQGGNTEEALAHNKRWRYELENTRMLETQRIRVHVQRKYDLIQSLEKNGMNMGKYALAEAVFTTLPSYFDIHNTAGNLCIALREKSASEMASELERAAIRLKWVDGVGPPAPVVQSPKVAAVTTSAARARDARSVQAQRDFSTIRCFNCGEFGHFDKRCPLPTRPQAFRNQVRREVQQAAQARNRAGRVTTFEDWTQQGGPGSSQDEGDSPNRRLLSITNSVFDPGIRSSARDVFCADSGATITLTHNFAALHEPTVFSKPKPIFLATTAVGGTVAIGSLCLRSGNQVAWVHNVHCDPSATQNLLSVSAAIALGFSFKTNAKGDYVSLHTPQGHFCDIEKKDGLYNLVNVQLVPPAPEGAPFIPVGSSDVLQESDDVLVSRIPVTRLVVSPGGDRAHAVSDIVVSQGERGRMLLHQRMGHCNPIAVDRLIAENLVDGLPAGLPVTGTLPEVCEDCIRGRGGRRPFTSSEKPPTRPLQRISMDTAVMRAIPGIRGEQYFTMLVDEFTGYKIVLIVQRKDQIPGAIIACLIRLMNQLRDKGFVLKQIRTDRGTEFHNRYLKGFTVEHGIDMQASCAYTPQQNGVAERAIKTAKDRTRTIMVGVKGPVSLWTEALQYAIDISNCLPVKGKPLTPHEALWGDKPDISLFRRWGCKAYVMVPDVKRKHTLSDVYVEGMFVGFEKGTKGWKIRLPNRSTITSREVKFLEDKLGGGFDGEKGMTDAELKLLLDDDEGVTVDEETPVEPLTTRPVETSSTPTPEGATPSSLPAASVGGGTSEATTVLRRSPRFAPQPTVPASAAQQTPRWVAVTPVRGQTAPAPGEAEAAGEAGEEISEPGEATRSSAQDAQAPSQPSIPAPAQATTAPSPSRPLGIPSFPRATLRPTSARPEPRRSARLQALEAKRQAEVEKKRRERDPLPGFVVEPRPGGVMDGITRGSIITDGRDRYWINARDKGHMTDEGVSALQREVMEVERNRSVTETEDPTAGIPVHENVFQRLSTVEESEEVNITDFTGKDHMASGTDTYDVSRDRTGDLTGQDPIAHLISVHTQWIGHVPEGKRSALRKSSEGREGYLQVQFAKDVTVREVHRDKEQKQPWESPMDWERESVIRARMQRAKDGDVRPVVNRAVAEAAEAENVFAKVNACRVDHSKDVSGPDMTEEMHQWYNGGPEPEVYEDALFEHAPERPMVFSVTGSTGVTQRVPKTLREAQASPQWPYWNDACKEEVNSIDKHGARKLVPRPVGKRVLPAIWVLQPKFNSEGIIVRHKARLVAGGHRQRRGIDVGETYAPTAMGASRRALISVAAALDYEIHQTDIKTAFLHGDLEEEVYMEQPPGYGNGDPNMVWLLTKSLYGLKQSPRCWWMKLTHQLRELQFEPCKSDPGLYVNLSDQDSPLWLSVFVDDISVIGKDLPKVEKFKKDLTNIFEIHDLGEIGSFLGVRMSRDREKRVIYLSMPDKIDEYCEEFDLKGNTVPVSTPMDPGFVQTIEEQKNGTPKQLKSELNPGAGKDLAPGHRFGELLGCLLYIANQVRPDISTATGIISQYREKPTTAHWNEAMRILRYLKGTRLHSLRLGGGGPVMQAFTDADFGNNRDSRHSRSGFCVQVMGGTVSWGSKKQKTVTLNTVEAEFQAACLAIKEVRWMRGLLNELGIKVGDVNLFCDNEGCLAHLNNPVVSQFTKHASIRFHFAREAVVLGHVKPQFVGSKDNVADIMTKPLHRVDFERHRDSLGILPYNPLPKGKC